MTKEDREVIADWLIVAGGLVLFVSLFFTWSHQFSADFLSQFGASDLLRGVPRDPTAWQVYSSADVMLALVAAGLVAVALLGNRPVRVMALAGATTGFGFTLHALSSPPSNGANVFNPAVNVPQYVPNGATAGAGETIALIGLLLAGVGLLLSFAAD